MKIALCASFSFYEHVAQLEDELLALGHILLYLLDEINGLEPIPLCGNSNLLQSEE